MSADAHGRSLGAHHAIGILVVGHVLLALGVLFFVAIAMLARDLSYGEAMHRVTTNPVALGGAQLAALTAAIAFGARLASDERDWVGLLSIEPTTTRVIILAFVAGLALQLPLVELTTLLGDLLPGFAHDAATEAAIRETTRIDSPLRAIAVPFAFVVVAPVTEELLFRGLLLPALATRHGTRAAVALTAILFGLFHLDTQAVVYASAMGFVLGALRVRSGSVLPAIALHAGFNALPVVLPEEIWPITGFNVPETDHVPAWIVVLALAISTAALGALWVTLRAEPKR